MILELLTLSTLLSGAALCVSIVALIYSVNTRAKQQRWQRLHQLTGDHSPKWLADWQGDESEEFDR